MLTIYYTYVQFQQELGTSNQTSHFKNSKPHKNRYESIVFENRHIKNQNLYKYLFSKSVICIPRFPYRTIARSWQRDSPSFHFQEQHHLSQQIRPVWFQFTGRPSERPNAKHTHTSTDSEHRGKSHKNKLLVKVWRQNKSGFAEQVKSAKRRLTCLQTHERALASPCSREKACTYNKPVCERARARAITHFHAYLRVGMSTLITFKTNIPRSKG